MGFKEKKTKTSMIIEIDKNVKNTFAEQVYQKYTEDKEINEVDATEKTFELVIIWLNRLLFIKLVEGQLLSFNNNSDDCCILRGNKIKNFQNLQDLFFNVLGRKNRPSDGFYTNFKEIPYLNSSLFEKRTIEKEDININELRNDLVIVKNRSILKGKKNQSLPLLEYLLSFLNSYIFSSSEEGANQEIINSNVLGLIFEKINGYKDGAVFTPSQITEYICRTSIEQAVINKINNKYNWDCSSLDEIKYNNKSITTAREISDLIDTIKICDPAVGSGHFLVSALNRIIAIKYYLGVLFKYNKNEILNEVDIYIEGDSLCVVNAQNNAFVYDKENVSSQNIQMTLFNEKRKIIENCLFAEDMYNDGYKNIKNIDINIKSGNSLISRVEFNVGKKTGDLDFDLKDNKYISDTFVKYRKAVKEYKSVSDKKVKQEILSSIQSLKSMVYNSYSQLTFNKNYEEQIKNMTLYENAFEWSFEFPEIIGENGTFNGFDVIVENPPYGMINKKQNQKVGISTNIAELDYYKNEKEYSPALGGQINIFRLFICRSIKLLNKNGICSFIFPLSFACDISCSTIRDFVFNNTQIRYLEVFPERDNANKRVFKEAKVSVCILSLYKSKPKKNQIINMRIHNDNLVDENGITTYISLKDIDLIDKNNRAIPLVNQNELKLLSKISNGSLRLETISKCYTGEIDMTLDKPYISSDDNDDTLLRGAQVQKYKITDEISQGELIYLKSSHYLTNKGNNGKSQHHNSPRIVMQGITGVNEKYRLKMTIIENGQYCANSVNYIVMNNADSLKYLLGLLNSNLIEWYFSRLSTNSNVNGYEVNNLPIKFADEITTNQIIRLVDLCLNNSEIESYKNQINTLVYGIYGLNENDVDVIESYFK